VVAVLAGCAVIGSSAARSMYRSLNTLSETVVQTEPYYPATPPTSPPQVAANPKLAWFGNDRYLAIQTSRNLVQNAQNVPVPQVIVWDRETKTSEVVGDYVLVGAERAFPRIYLNSASGDDEWGDPYAGMDERPPYDQYDDLFDDMPYDFFAWSPGQKPALLDDDTVSWSPWKGSGKSSVEAIIDNGSSPINLFFSTGGERIKANTYGFFSCEPVGWSPSGAYFAVVTLQDAYSEFYQQFDALADAALLQSMQNRVLIYSAADGTVVYETPLGTGRAASVSSAVMWDSTSDMLYHQVIDSPPGEPFTQVTGARLAAVDLTGAKPTTLTVGIPDTWQPGDWSFLGTQSAGALIIETTGESRAVWRISSGVLSRVGTLDLPPGTVSLAAARDGAVAWLYASSTAEDAPLVCAFSERIQGSAHPIWEEDE